MMLNATLESQRGYRMGRPSVGTYDSSARDGVGVVIESEREDEETAG